MKLGEARLEIQANSVRINLAKRRLVVGSPEEISDTLDKINGLLNTNQSLAQRIKLTEQRTRLGDTSLLEVVGALSLIQEKIKVLEVLSVRQDLDSLQKEGISSQLLNYRSTRDTLSSAVDKCLWETDLLDE